MVAHWIHKKRYRDTTDCVILNSTTKYPYKKSTLNGYLEEMAGVKQYVRSHNGGYSKEIKLLLNQPFQTAGDEFHVIVDTGKIAVLIPTREEAKELIGRLERGTNVVNFKKKILRKLQRYVVNLSADRYVNGNAIRTIADGMAMVLNEIIIARKRRSMRYTCIRGIVQVKRGICVERYRNTIEFEVYGKYALSDPVTRVGGRQATIFRPTKR